jgi:hypothetical protein
MNRSEQRKASQNSTAIQTACALSEFMAPNNSYGRFLHHQLAMRTLNSEYLRIFSSQLSPISPLFPTFADSIFAF